MDDFSTHKTVPQSTVRESPKSGGSSKTDEPAVRRARTLGVRARLDRRTGRMLRSLATRAAKRGAIGVRVRVTRVK